MIGCLFNPLSCAPDWLTFILGYWEWLLAAFLLGLAIGALTGWKGLLVALTGGLALFWLWSRRKPAPSSKKSSKRFDIPWESGDHEGPAWDVSWKRRHRPEIGGPRGTWQRQNPVTGRWENE